MKSVRDCNVTVIGGAGFLGSHLVDHLVEDRNCKVLVLDNLVSGQQKHVHKDATLQRYDIRDNHLAQSLSRHGTKFVFNYAAEPYVPECFERPLYFLEVNTKGTLKILEESKRARVEAILQVSSAEIYGEVKGKIKETDTIEAHSTYGVSKLAADGLVKVRWRESQIPAIALRQFNCVGERETHEYVIPEIISQLDEGSTIRLGNNTLRDFLYAGDAVRMAVELLERGKFGEAYNLGSEETISIHDLTRMIASIMGRPSIEIIQDSNKQRPWEIWSLQSDNTKIYNAITYRPKVGLQEAIEKTIEYFYSNGKKWDW